MVRASDSVRNMLSVLREWLENRPIVSRPTDTFDERDTMFARAARQAGTAEYSDYYDHRPEYQHDDDRIRRKPPLGSPDSLYYDETSSQKAQRYFETIEDIEPDSETVSKWATELESASNPEPMLASLTTELGAVDVGFTTLPSEYIYSHAGRFDENYGKPVTLDHQYAVVFLVEMDHDTMSEAPKPPVLHESAKQYYRAAYIAKTLAAVFQSQGANAKPQYDAHYEVILPPLAVKAGLGELARNNILVADKYGSRVRIGAVTTTLPLQSDDPISLGVERFCRSCNRCATSCPARALETGSKKSVRGTEKWSTDETRCYSFWRQAGTDCGICMATCPFSHPNTMLHNTTRRIIKHAPWLAPVFLWIDDHVYDRSPEMSGPKTEKP
jgi:reductive dehalogenase